MQPVSLEEIETYVAENIPAFHQNRIEKIKGLRLKTVLRRKNPYLFKVKAITTAGDFVKTILDAYLSSQEETLFGGFLEGLAAEFQVVALVRLRVLPVAAAVDGHDVLRGRGVGAEDALGPVEVFPHAADLAGVAPVGAGLDGDDVARAVLVQFHVDALGRGLAAAVNPAADEQGQSFWAFISGTPDLYTDIIEPLGHRAKEKNEQFLQEYAKVANIFTREFIQDFCGPDGEILWKKLIAFNSGEAGK